MRAALLTSSTGSVNLLAAQNVGEPEFTREKLAVRDLAAKSSLE